MVVLIGLRSGPTRTGMRSFGPKPLPCGPVATGVEAVAVDVVVCLRDVVGT